MGRQVLLAALCAVGSGMGAIATGDADASAPLGVDWARFLGRADLISEWSRASADAAWDRSPPYTYDLAAFIGNGNVGAMVQAEPQSGSVTLVLGRTDVFDRRTFGTPFAVDKILCDVAKLPIGNLTLHTAGKVLSARMRTRLWDAEVSLTLKTTAGELHSRILGYGGGDAPSGGASGIVVAQTNATGGETAAAWRFSAANANANAPHPVYKTESYACSDKAYQENPAAVIASAGHGQIKTSEQSLLAGPRYATALGVGTTLAVLATTPPLNGSAALRLAVADTQWALGGWDRLLAEHQQSWHRFYTQASFLSISHPRLEQFYWITQYKLGSGMGLRGDLTGVGGVMDHTSPWYLPNNGLLNWDLNIEMTWWHVAGANRASLVEPLLRFIESVASDLCQNVVAAARDADCSGAGPFQTLAGPSAHTGYLSVGRIEVGHHDPGCSSTDRCIEPPGPLGDLVWTLTDVHQAWELTRNESLGRRLYPLLSAATNQYVHWLNRSADGLYHLPPTFSPEYLRGPGDGDTSYDLAICRWGLRATLELASELGIDHDPRSKVFRDRLANLANFSTDSRGLSVARGLPFSQPHRHFSHLLGIVLRDPTVIGDTQLLKHSVDNWRSLRDPCTMSNRPKTKDAGWVGFSYAVSALLNSRLQRPSLAIADVTHMAENSAVQGRVGAREGPIPETEPCPEANVMNGSAFHANTFYAEGVGDPTGETPFGTCAALQEVLVGTAADGSIAAFPGLGDGSVPTALTHACFHNLRVSGAFLVSGCFKENATQFVSVTSEAGRPGRVELPSMRPPFAALPASAMGKAAGRAVELKLGPGETATIYTKGGSTDFVVDAVAIEPSEANFWGQVKATDAW